MKHHTHIFFDLDHTLWDYDFNARKVLSDLFLRFGLADCTQTSVDGFISTFFKTNAELWHRFNLGLIERELIREERFRMILRTCGGKDEAMAKEIGDYFLHHCPRQPRIMEGADVLLGYLQDRYHLSIITNGFEDVQHIKLKHCGLGRFFARVFTSETIGFRKPSPEIFDYAMKETKAEKHLALMIGDNHSTDIEGARNAGITPILFNPTGKVKSDCEIQISSLSELMKLL